MQIRISAQLWLEAPNEEKGGPTSGCRNSSDGEWSHMNRDGLGSDQGSQGCAVGLLLCVTILVANEAVAFA
jgi:hypothetical protein